VSGNSAGTLPVRPMTSRRYGRLITIGLSERSDGAAEGQRWESKRAATSGSAYSYDRCSGQRQQCNTGVKNGGHPS